MRKRSWPAFAVNALWGSLCAGFCAYDITCRYWSASAVIAACFLYSGYEAYRALWPRCHHEREVLVGRCGDRRIVSMDFAANPLHPDEVTLDVTLVESAKLRCLDCGRVRLWKPSEQLIQELQNKQKETKR